MGNTIIQMADIGKTFRVAQRSAGFKQAFKSLFVRRYSQVEALKQLNFTVREGEIVGYIGPNGAGKSTTIKVMCGILVPDAGTCRILGLTPWQERLAYVRQIGVVFGQRSQLWWDVPVIDSFELLREIYRIDKAVYRANLAMLTETLSLGPLLPSPVRQLSLGQRMRCEIAASLLHGPRILFLDEPTIGLDAASKLAVRNFIRTLNREKGVTVILTTHDMSDIEALADRILMIGRGQLLYDGTLAELRRRFGSQRMVTLDYRAHGQPVEVPGASLLDWSEERATYRFDSQHISLAEVISQASAHMDVLDVAVDAQSIDEVILKLYEEHRV